MFHVPPESLFIMNKQNALNQPVWLWTAPTIWISSRHAGTKKHVLSNGNLQNHITWNCNLPTDHIIYHNVHMYYYLLCKTEWGHQTLLQWDTMKKCKACKNMHNGRHTMHVNKAKNRSQQWTCDTSANTSNGVITKWLPGRWGSAFSTIASTNAIPYSKYNC